MTPQRDASTLADWAIRGEAVVTPEGIRPAAVLVRGERIVAVVGPNEVPAGVPVVEAGEGRYVLPGLVDAHVHINEPGRTDWEGFATATRAAAAGGITTLIDMPLNSSPVTTTVAALRQKQAAAAGKLSVDVGFHAGIVPGNLADVAPLIAAGVCAFKAFLCHSGIDEFPNATEADLRAVMPLLAQAGLPLFVHAELESPLPPGVAERFAATPCSYAAYLATRPPEWELAAIRLMIDLCREYRCQVHVVHLAAPEARPLIAAAKAEGLPLTVETCPHYLRCAMGDIPDGAPVFKCAPPIRGFPDDRALHSMVSDGEIDTIGSDHSPAPPNLKHLDDGNLRLAWGGIASLELLLPATWSAMWSGSRQFPVNNWIDSLTARPATLVGLDGRKGAIAAGRDADLVVFDHGHAWHVDQNRLQHRHKATPYHGMMFRGMVVTTYLRGRKIYDQGIFFGEPNGQLLERPRT